MRKALGWTVAGLVAAVGDAILKPVRSARAGRWVASAALLGVFLVGCGPAGPSDRAKKVLQTAGANPMALRKASLEEFDPILGRTRCWCCKETLKTCFEGTLAGQGCPAGWKTCLDEGRDVLQMLVDGKSEAEIYRTIDDRYRAFEPPAMRGKLKGSG
jgi:hypothetical protein